jgi:hypothetical protein
MSMIRRHFIWAAAALVLALTGSAQAAKPLPAELQPAGYKLVLTAKARGVQIYKSVADTDGHFKWMFEAPLAELTDAHGKLAFYHYNGPSWEAPDGSKIARDTATPVVQVPAAHPATDVPWLLAKVAADPAPGVLAQVGFVQRLDTHGGQAPATPPTRADTRVGVPYTATYAFFAKVP